MQAVDIGMTEGTGVNPEMYGETVGEAGGAMGKDQFLELLITEMQNQDPLDPVDNKEMIAQLAQFSSLEQMQNLNEKFELYQDNTSMAIGTLLTGRIGAVETGDGGRQTGEISEVAMDNGEIKFRLNGSQYDLSQLDQIFNN